MNFVTMTGYGAWIFVNEVLLLLSAAVMIMILHEQQQRDLMVSCSSTPRSHVEAICCPSLSVGDWQRCHITYQERFRNTTLNLPVTNRIKPDQGKVIRLNFLLRPSRIDRCLVLLQNYLQK
jgi:hypothetical protein